MLIKYGMIYLSIIISFSLKASKAGEITNKLTEITHHGFDELTTEQSKYYTIKLLQDRLSKDSDNLLLAKNSLVNGEHERAKLFLERILKKDKITNIIKNRYLALISFHAEEYEESLEFLKVVNPTLPSEYREVCLLKLMNYTALNKAKEYKKEAPMCLSSLDENDDRALFWFRQFRLLTTDKDQIIGYNYLDTIRDLNISPEKVALWLKLALYLGKEKEIIKMISKLPAEAYESGQNRELIALAYYRQGNTKMAQEFVSDLESANADNIKGNLNLEQGKPELAFGFYKLALQKKGNSLNAIKKGLPLSWELGLWDQALKLLDKVQLRNVDERKKLAFKAAVYLRKKDYVRARRTLNTLNYQYQSIAPLSIDLMESYLSIIENNKDQLAKSSDRSCQKFDGLNCYLQLKNLTMNRLPGSLKTKENSLDIDLEKFDIEEIKKMQEIIPLKEAIIIDQKDIEELDSLEFNNR